MLKFGSKSDVTVVHRAIVRLLDDSEVIQCDFQPEHKGKYLLDYVCEQLNIVEKDYFGLRYVDHNRQRHWLDLAKPAIKQVKDMDPIIFTFRVKFYPPDPLRLKEEITRYQIYQQLKRDLLHGRLYCSPGEASLLAACIIQSELGDYDPEMHEGNYVSEHRLLLKQTLTIEEKAIELHQTQLKGFTPEQAEAHFLKLASQLDTYGVDPHPVKDQKGTPIYLGINHQGILTFHGSRKSNHFRWPEVQKINYEGKMFIVHLTITEDLRTKKKFTVGFKCLTGSNCRHVWRCSIEQMLFFTLPRAADAPVMSGGSIFSWGTKFKYSGRTEREVLEESGRLRKEEPPIQRCHSTGLRRKASSVPATPSTPSQDLVELRYSSLPRSCHSAGLDGAGMSDATPMSINSPYSPDNTLPLLETVCEDQEIHARRNNALDESDTHASATTYITTFTTITTTTTSSTTANQANKQKIPKSTLATRPQALLSQKIVIGPEDLAKGDLEKVVRERIDALEKSPKVIRSTVLIVKKSIAPAKARLTNGDGPNARRIVPNGRRAITDGQVSRHELDGDYYFRDSFDHSFSESQLLDSAVNALGSKYSGRSVSGPVPKMQRLQNTKITNIQATDGASLITTKVEAVKNIGQFRNKSRLTRASICTVKLIVPVVVLTITVLFIAIVLVFETDSILFEDMRRRPEIIALRNHFYKPIRNFLKARFGLV